MKGYSIHILPALNRDGMGLNRPGDCQNKAGSLNQAGVDLDNDFHSFESSQPETKRIMKWMDERKFLFSLNLLANHENIVVPGINDTSVSTNQK